MGESGTAHGPDLCAPGVCKLCEDRREAAEWLNRVIPLPSYMPAWGKQRYTAVFELQKRDEAMRREGEERWLSYLELDSSEPGFWGRAVARLLKRQRDTVTRDEAEHLMTVARHDKSRGVLGILDEFLQSRQAPETRGEEG